MAGSSMTPPEDEALSVEVTKDFASLADEWHSFQESADCTPFQTYEWLDSWLRCIGEPASICPLIVAVRRSSGELLMLLPLAMERKGFLRRLVFLGRGLCDYNAPLLHRDVSTIVSRGRAREMWDRAQAEIERHCGRPHVILLDRMPAEIGGQPNPLMDLTTQLNPSAAYAASLTSDWDGFYAAHRSSTTRRRDRSKRKKLAENGAIELLVAEGDDISTTLNRLFAQKQRAFERMGVGNLFAKPGYQAFFVNVAQSAPSLVHVSRLSVGGSCAANNLGLIFQGCYYYVLASYNDGPMSRHAPGTAHLHELMRLSIARGLTRFDFTIGDESYKLDWADTKTDLFDHVSGRGWIGRPLALAMSLMLRTKRAIKHTPWAWNLVNQVRQRIMGSGVRA